MSYTAQFSSDLGTFTNSSEIPTKVADSSVDRTNYEVTKEPFPAGTKFARVKIEATP